MVTVSGNPNPTNPTTKYRCESVNLNCKITMAWNRSPHPGQNRDIEIPVK